MTDATRPAVDGATAAVPAAVAEALADPSPGEDLWVEAAGIRFHALAWGDPAARPLLLLHGVTSSAGTWWRVGPALAAAGHRVVAPDLPGHGLTGSWAGHHRFADNAADLAAFARAAGIATASLDVVGHSWGAVTAAALPAAGLRPARLVLVDPPAVPLALIAAMSDDPVERRYDDPAEAYRVIRAANPGWTEGDVRAKADGLSRFDEAAVRAVLGDNGDWDGGLAALADPAAGELPVWVVRGDPATGGLLPDGALPAFAERVGRDRIVTIPGAPHSPHRTHPVATLAALLGALAT